MTELQVVEDHPRRQVFEVASLSADMSSSMHRHESRLSDQILRFSDAKNQFDRSQTLKYQIDLIPGQGHQKH